MARVSKPMHNVSAGVAPSAVPDGAGSAPITDAEPVAAIAVDDGPIVEPPDVSAPEIAAIAIRAFLSIARDKVDDIGELHSHCEMLARVAAQVGDQANHGKLARLGNVIAEFRNGLIASLS